MPDNNQDWIAELREIQVTLCEHAEDRELPQAVKAILTRAAVVVSSAVFVLQQPAPPA